MLYNKKFYIFGLWFIFFANLALIYFVFHLTYELFTIGTAQLIIMLIVYKGNEIEKKRTIKFIELKQSDIDNFHSCVICLDEDITNIVKLECGHLYHKICIYPWLESHNNCPICRESVIEC